MGFHTGLADLEQVRGFHSEGESEPLAVVEMPAL